MSGWGLQATQAQKTLCGDHRQSSVRESLRKELQKLSDRDCAHGKATSKALTAEETKVRKTLAVTISDSEYVTDEAPALLLELLHYYLKSRIWGGLNGEEAMPGQSNWVNRDATNWSIDSRRSNQPQEEEEGVRWGRQSHCMPRHSQSCLGHIDRDYQRTRDRSSAQQRAANSH